MYGINPNCGFPFYTAKKQQTFRKDYSHGEGLTGIMCKQAKIPPFQLSLAGASLNITAFELYDQNDVMRESIDVNSLETRTDSERGFVYFSGNIGQVLNCGAYRYVRLRINSTDYYSELFRVEILL